MFCSNCGNKIEDGNNFCEKCGNRISSFGIPSGMEAGADDTVSLVDRAKAGDESAFHQLYDRTSKRNYYVALKMVKTDADAQDVLQDAYIRIYQHLDRFQYQGEGSFASWSSKIVSNTALNHLRKKQMVLFSEIEGDQEGEFSLEIEDEDTSRQPELAYDKKETSKIVQDLLGTLSDEQRVCAMMFYFQEESVKDIASEIGCSENTVKSRLNYARKNMMAKAEELKKKGILTGILSIAGLFAILRSNEAMAMEHVPSGVYSAVSGSINWESMAAYAGNTGGSVSSGAVSGGVTSESAIAGGASSGMAASGGTATTGAVAAGAAVSAGLSIKAIVAIVIASVVVLAGGITAVVLVNNSNSVDTVSENSSENGEGESGSDSVSGSATDVNDQKEEDTPDDIFKKYLEQYTFLTETGKEYTIKPEYGMSDDGEYTYEVSFPEEVRNNPIGYDIDDYDHDGVDELLIVNHSIEMNEYGFESNRIILEMYEDVNNEVVLGGKLEDFGTDPSSGGITGRLTTAPGKFDIVKFDNSGQKTIFLEESEEDHGEGEAGYVAFSYTQYDGSGFSAAVGVKEINVDVPDFASEQWQSLKQFGIDYTEDAFWKGTLPSKLASDCIRILSATAKDNKDDETVVKFSGNTFEEESAVDVKRVKEAYKDFFDSNDGIISVNGIWIDLLGGDGFEKGDYDFDMSSCDRYDVYDIDGDKIPEMILRCGVDFNDGSGYSENSIMICRYENGEVIPVYKIIGCYMEFYVYKANKNCILISTQQSGYGFEIFFEMKDGVIAPKCGFTQYRDDENFTGRFYFKYTNMDNLKTKRISQNAYYHHRGSGIKVGKEMKFSYS